MSVAPSLNSPAYRRQRRILCVVCLKSKPLADFALNTDGERSSECRSCAITSVRHLLAANRVNYS